MSGQGPRPAWSAGASPEEVEFSEQLCRTQADILGMGEDNYQRLCRICPDPRQRYRVLLTRVDHWFRDQREAPGQLRPHRNTPWSATVDAGGGVQIVLESDTSAPENDARATSQDAFVAGEPKSSEWCWRCNARSAAGDLGLCEPCHAELAAGGDE